MFIGPEAGCQLVPEPIAPIDIRFVLLEPTRIPMSLPDITINGPMFIGPIFIEPISIGPISISGECAGDGDGVGVMSIAGCLVGSGVGEDAGFGDGIPGMVCPWC